MRLDVTYWVSRIACVVHSSCVRCSLFCAPSHMFVLLSLFLCRPRHHDSQANYQQLNSCYFFHHSFLLSQVQPRAGHQPSSQPGKPVVFSSPMVSTAATANPLPAASTTVLLPDLMTLVNQAVQVAVQASQRQPEPAIACPAFCLAPVRHPLHRFSPRGRAFSLP